MAKKSNTSKKKKRVITSISPADKQLDLIGHQIFQGNYAEAVTTCERLLKYLPQHAPQRVDVLAQLGTAQGMLQNFQQSYEAFTQALEIDPKYTLAKSNLAALPGFRRTGPPALVALNEPFKSSKLKQTITFLKE